MNANRQDRFSLADIGKSFRAIFAVRLRRRNTSIGGSGELRSFLESRASFVAQTSLYGYLRTRAGMRYPVLFDDDRFARSVNIAKWHVWLACLSDLCVFTGGLIAHRGRVHPDRVGALMASTFDGILEAHGTPADAGSDFADHAQRVRARLALCNWATVADDATAFTESGPALVRWSPIADELKEHDGGIVRNSIRFIWQDVRRDLRRDLDAAAIAKELA